MSVSPFASLTRRWATVCLLLATPLAFSAGVAAAEMAVGNAAAGEKLTTACQACHGVDGNSIIPANPSLAGQNERYLFRQLQMIQTNARSCLLYTSDAADE